MATFEGPKPNMMPPAEASETQASEQAADLLGCLLQDAETGMEVKRVDRETATAQVVLKEPNIDAHEAVRRLREAIQGRRDELRPQIQKIYIEN